MDVHPPLAKLLLTLAGWLAGFDGEFDFKDIGKDYLEPGVPYVAMRMLPAICGILLVPTMFLTLKASGCRTLTSAMGACLIVFGKDFSLQQEQFLISYRKRSPHPGTIDSSRLPSHDHDRFHCIGIHIIHESTRTRTIKGIPTKLVALACFDWSWFGRYCQC
jgi:Dolichyl-phosphate-mannose-protein mannosyltransferase